MDKAITQLHDLAARVREAAEASDWEGLVALDRESREQVVEVVEAAKADQLDIEQAKAAVDDVLRSFEAAREHAVTARDEAAKRLRESGRSQEAAKAYLNQSGKPPRS